jgi:hypothetical protein
MELKACSRCKFERLSNEYCRNKYGKDCLHWVCNKCLNELYMSRKKKVQCECGNEVNESYLNKHIQTDLHMRNLQNMLSKVSHEYMQSIVCDTKKCCTCKVIKNFNEFHKGSSECKPCKYQRYVTFKDVFFPKVNCSCGRRIFKHMFDVHLNSKIHKKLIQRGDEASSLRSEVDKSNLKMIDVNSVNSQLVCK